MVSSAAFRTWSWRSARICWQRTQTWRFGPNALRSFSKKPQALSHRDHFPASVGALRDPPSPGRMESIRSASTRDPENGKSMQIQCGYELVYQCEQVTPMIVTLDVHYSRHSDMIRPGHLKVHPSVPVRAYRDSFGNW